MNMNCDYSQTRNEMKTVEACIFMPISGSVEVCVELEVPDNLTTEKEIEDWIKSNYTTESLTDITGCYENKMDYESVSFEVDTDIEFNIGYVSNQE